MYKIEKLSDLRGNNVSIYLLNRFIENGNMPPFLILSGKMGVGKSTAAQLVAAQIDKSELPIKVYNLGLEIKMSELEAEVFKMNPVKKRVFIFEELHGLDKSQQTALLTMIDSQPSNVIVIATTTELNKILRTVRSRATILDFKPLSAKQLSELLDDYLKSVGFTLPEEARNMLIRSSYGVARDLIKNTELILEGKLDITQMYDLLDCVSDNLMFSLLCALKSKTSDFCTAISAFSESAGQDKVFQLRDFFTRFLLECNGASEKTIDKEKIEMLHSIYSREDLLKIGRTLSSITSDTWALRLTMLNMELTNTSTRTLTGQQSDTAIRHNATTVETVDRGKLERAKLTSSNLKGLLLDG